MRSLRRHSKSLALTNGTCVQSTHHGLLDVLGHGAMIAYVFPLLKGAFAISQCRTASDLLRGRIRYMGFDCKESEVRANAIEVRTCK